MSDDKLAAVYAAEALDQYREENKRLRAQIESMERIAEVNSKFYGLAIAERDYERARCDRLEHERNGLRHLLEQVAGEYIDHLNGNCLEHPTIIEIVKDVLKAPLRCMWCPAGKGGTNTAHCTHCNDTGVTDHVPSWSKKKCEHPVTTVRKDAPEVCASCGAEVKS